MKSFFIFSQMVVSVVVASFMLALTACSTNKPNESQASAHMRKGTLLIEQGQYSSAVSELLQAEHRDSSDAKIQNNLGLAYLLSKNYALAEQHLLRALVLSPAYSEARNNYARALIEDGKYDEAVNQLEKVVADPAYTQPTKAWINLGTANFSRKDFDKAKDDFSKVIVVDRSNCFAQTMLGRTFFETGDYAASARTLDHATLICEKVRIEEAPYFAGLAYFKLGNRAAAAARMESFIKDFPNSQYTESAHSILDSTKK